MRRSPLRAPARLALTRLEGRDVPAVVSFQQAAAGYAGTHDTFLLSAASAQVNGGTTNVSIDQSAGTGMTQGLLRFDNIFGNGPGQIPLGATINSATLRVYVTSPSDAGASVAFHRALTDWDQATATWAAFGNGIQFDGTEAAATPDGTVPDPTAANAFVDIPLTASVAAWSAGLPNRGWAIQTAATNGWDFASSEFGVPNGRQPRLTVDYTAPTGPGTLRLAAAAVSVDEAAGTVTLTVERVNGTAGAVTVQYATAPGTAAAGDDYTPAAGTLTFAAGQASATVTVPILNDAAVEPNETFTVTLSAPGGGATLGTPAAATVTILDNDGPGTLQFAAATVTAVEDVPGGVTLTVTRTGGVGGPVAVDYATANGTGTAGTDYVATAGTLQFAAGQASATVTVPLVPNTAARGERTFTVTLAAPAGGAALGATAAATVTVQENDLLLNELDINPPGVDNPFEYVELRGTATAGLDNVYFVAIEGDGDAFGVNPGVFTTVVPLAGAAPGANGLLVIKSPTGGFTIPAGTPVIGASQFETGDALGNDTTTFALVYSTTPLVEGADYDANDNGTLELLPNGANLFDAVTVADRGAGDLFYSAVLFNEIGGIEPSALTRLPASAAPKSAAAFYSGVLAGTAGDSVTYDPALASPNMPAGAVLTPGAANVSPAAAPRVQGVTVNAGQANTTQRSKVTTVTVTFDSVVTFAGPVEAAFGLSRIGGGAVGGFTATAAVADGRTVVTLSGFTGAETEFGSLADGRYSVLVRAGQVTANGQQLDGDGNGQGGDDYALAGSVANGLFRLFGDVDGSGVVNAFDYSQFRTAFGSSVGQTTFLAFLDIDGDNVINGFDFARFRTRFGSPVP